MTISIVTILVLNQMSTTLMTTITVQIKMYDKKKRSINIVNKTINLIKFTFDIIRLNRFKFHDAHFLYFQQFIKLDPFRYSM